MDVTPNTFQNTKNRRRLVHQNIKLFKQVAQIQYQISLLEPEEPLDNSSMLQSQFKPLLSEIAIQEKTIRKLQKQIEMYQLEKAKDNVEYIVREEDDLKIAKKQEAKLIDQKNIYLNKKADKDVFLHKDVPYQQYEKNFLENLHEVVRSNREQAAKITQVEREIRKYHLIKQSKQAPQRKVASPEQLQTVQSQIDAKIQAKRGLQSQWKPHFLQLDQQYASLLHKASLKRQELAQLEKQQKTWQIRISAIKDPEEIISDRERLVKVHVSQKLKKKLADLMQAEEDKKKKKVNHQMLMLQFMAKKAKEAEKTKKQKEEVSDKPVISLQPPTLLPGQKKKEQKIQQTEHNDKNVSKKIQKGSPKKGLKTSQTSNTELSISPKGLKAKNISRQNSPSRKPLAQQQKVSRTMWGVDSQISESQREPKSPTRSMAAAEPKDPNLLLLRQISIGTQRFDVCDKQ